MRGPIVILHLAAALLFTLVLAAMGTMLTAPSATAAPPSGFVGTQSWDDPSESELAGLRSANVKTFRTTLSWASVESQAPTDCTSSTCANHTYRWSRYDQMRAALKNTTASSKPLWLTEFGWADSGPPSSFTVSERTQARYLRETYRKLLAIRSSYGVHGAIWFNLKNVVVPADEDAWYHHTGLFMSGGRAKDSWYAFKCVNIGGSTNCRYGK
jgi:hypothetical protein